MRSVVLVTLLLAILTQAGSKTAMATANTLKTKDVCELATRAAERMQHVPRLLLHAVSLAESGRWNKDEEASVAWPWTITASGQGRFFRTKEEAINEIRRLRANGVENIDVGCMQVNLKYHGDAFTRIEEALDPIHNVAYAAAWLKQLRGRVGSWAHAVGRYHTSRWKARGQDYWRKVHVLWTSERKRDFQDRRTERIRTSLRRRNQARNQPRPTP